MQEIPKEGYEEWLRSPFTQATAQKLLPREKQSALERLLSSARRSSDADVREAVVAYDHWHLTQKVFTGKAAS